MYLTRIDRGANLYRYYRMEIVPGLFGDWGLVREWGRIGRGSQTRTDWFGTETEAQNARIELHTERAKRSYV